MKFSMIKFLAVVFGLTALAASDNAVAEADMEAPVPRFSQCVDGYDQGMELFVVAVISDDYLHIQASLPFIALALATVQERIGYYKVESGGSFAVAADARRSNLCYVQEVVEVGIDELCAAIDSGHWYYVWNAEQDTTFAGMLWASLTIWKGPADIKKRRIFLFTTYSWPRPEFYPPDNADIVLSPEAIADSPQVDCPTQYIMAPPQIKKVAHATKSAVFALINNELTNGNDEYNVRGAWVELLRDEAGLNDYWVMQHPWRNDYVESFLLDAMMKFMCPKWVATTSTLFPEDSTTSTAEAPEEED